MIKNYTIPKWTLKEITLFDQLKEIERLVRDCGFTLISADTETTGLHIINDKAFCITFTIVNEELNQGKAFVLNIQDKPEVFITLLENIFMLSKKLIFWNAKYDLHMLYNIGMYRLIKHKGITDAMIYARLAADAITTDKGGVNLQLKPYSVKNLDSEAQTYERQVSLYKRELAIKQNNDLKKQGVKVGELKAFLSDKINSIEDLPKEVQEILINSRYDAGNYKNIPWDILSQYAAFDAIFTMENYLRDRQTVIKREQLPVAEREEQLIPLLWEMERYGFKLNKQYLKQSKLEMKYYILERRQQLNELFGQQVKVGQHQLIKDLFYQLFNIVLESADEDHLKEIKQPEKAKEIADIIIELRTLEKWYSTYICKWEEAAANGERIYTSFKQVGAVSGRFSCDFQQFPKEPIYKADGTKLFSARRIVQVSGGDFDELCLIDYAAEELRIQALYTVLIQKPDKNLCRAYMPFDCTERNGKYYLNEDLSKEWSPTDLHTLTTLTAFPDKKESDEDFGHFRKLGKCTNFACNYGATASTLEKQFGFSPEVASKLYNAYNTAFPGVADYKRYVQNTLRFQEYVTNLFGRRYYNCSWHNATNYLVQGSAADLLKIKLLEIYHYLKDNGYKSRMLCTIHDEIMFEIHKDEHYIIPKLKEILQNVPNSPIPFVAEVSISKTTWDEKKEIKGYDESSVD